MQKVSRKTYILVLASAAVLLVAVLLVSLPFQPTGGESSVGTRLPLRISEVMSRNTAYPNADGVLCDWVEIENTSDEDFNISGYRLTDDITEAKFGFPVGTVIPAHGFITVWCEGTLSGGLYAPFSLSGRGGETLQLQNSANIVLDEVQTLNCNRNLSLVRCDDGSFTVSSQPTPGFPNTADGYTQYLSFIGSGSGALRLSEIMSSAKLYNSPAGLPCDWIEVENQGDIPADISGMHLSDTEGEMRYSFPEGTVLSPGDYVTVWCSGEAQGDFYAPFKLDKSGETVILCDEAGNVLDRAVLPYLADDLSFARVSGEWTVCATPSPGFANTEDGFAAFVASMGYGSTQVVISEIADKNRSGLADSDGEFTDWIELYNEGAEAVNLGGWYLSDKADELSKWKVPDFILQPGEYLVIRASGKNRTVNEFAADFALSTGETVFLVTPIGTLADSVQLPLIEEDHSYALLAGVWSECPVPTPGRSNG